MTASEHLHGRKALILGGLGFIGSNLAARLVERGADVTLVDSMLPQYGGNLVNIDPIKNRVKVNFSDIRDKHSLEYLVRDAELIFSLAGQTSHIDSMTDPLTDLEINCSSQLSVLECCRRNNPDVTIVYASTRQIYGRPQYLPVDEQHPVVPVDVNGVNKLAAENYYSLYSKIYGMRCVCLRLTNTYGPRQQLHGNSQGFVGIFLRLAMDGQKIRIFGDGNQKRDFNYIDDVTDAMLLAASSPDLAPGVFNLGSEDVYSLLEFVELLHKYCDFDHQLVPFPEDHRQIDIGDYYADYSLFHSVTGWQPQIDLEEGLRRTVDYFGPVRHHYWDSRREVPTGDRDGRERPCDTTEATVPFPPPVSTQRSRGEKDPASPGPSPPRGEKVAEGRMRGTPSPQLSPPAGEREPKGAAGERESGCVDTNAATHRAPRIVTFDYRKSLRAIRYDVNAAFRRVLASGHLILGPETEAFEDEFASFVGVRHCIGVSSGTTALQLALMALGVGDGDEVITVANTCLPTVSAIRSAGAHPIFVDVRPDDLMMDVQQVEAAITDRTRCLLPVHLWGQGVQMDRLVQIARRRSLAVVEDCAQAHQTKIDGRSAGTFGNVGCFSFYPTKNIGAYGDAGAVVTDDDALADALRRLRNYGLDGAGTAKRFGINARISEIQAAILRVKLRVYPQWLQARKDNARLYDHGICNEQIKTPARQPGVEHSYHQYVIRCENRDAIIEKLCERNIAYGIHYPLPMHRMPAYEAIASRLPRLPVTERAAEEILSLPIHESLTPAEARRVMETLDGTIVRQWHRAA